MAKDKVAVLPRTKDKEMVTFLETFDKQFGPKSLIEFDQGDILPVQVVSTGLPSLDYATGVGGLPRGRIIEIYGPEGAGKTSCVVRAMAEAQKNAGKTPFISRTFTGKAVKPFTGRCGFIDMEHAFDPSLAELHGLNIGKDSGFWFTQPDSGTDALKMLEYMVCSGLFDIVAIDSVHALSTAAEMGNDIGDQQVSGTAILMGQALKKLKGLISDSQTVVIFINQERDKPMAKYGSPTTTTGGRALKFYASMRIRVSKGEAINEGVLQIGHQSIFKIVKNKVAPPFEKTVIDLYYRDSEKKGKSTGYDTFSDFIETGKRTGVIELSGSQYRWVNKETGEIHKGNGLVAWKQYLSDNMDIYELIRNEIIGGGVRQYAREEADIEEYEE